MEHKSAGSVALASILILSLTGMGRINTDKSSHPSYSKMIGREYKTLVDLVIYKNSDSKTIFIDDYEGMSLNEEDMKSNFPFEHDTAKILGILPRGSKFKTIRITEEGSKTLSFVRYYANIISTQNRDVLNKEVNVSFLADYQPVPQFEPELVSELKNN